MKRIIPFLVTALAALSLSSCFQSSTTVRLNKDGSGTLVEETTLGEQMTAMLAQFAAMGGGAEDPVAEMFSEKKAKARAAKLGEGVVFEKSEPLAAGPNKGARTTYRFGDINKLKISTGDTVQDLSPMGQQAPAAGKVEPVTFTYADGKLVIAIPQPKKPDEPAEALPKEMENPEMEGMMKEMLKDMKMSLKIVIEPGIAETNATYREGNTITLMEVEMGKLLEKPEMMEKLRALDQENPAAAMEGLKGIEGVKGEARKEVTVTVG